MAQLWGLDCTKLFPSVASARAPWAEATVSTVHCLKASTLLLCMQDTDSTQQHWPFPHGKWETGYAYIMTHPGMPTVM